MNVLCVCVFFSRKIVERGKIIRGFVAFVIYIYHHWPISLSNNEMEKKIKKLKRKRILKTVCFCVGKREREKVGKETVKVSGVFGF